MKNAKRKIIPLLIIVLWITSILFVLFYFKPFEKNELQQQENVNEDLAETYLNSLSDLLNNKSKELETSLIDFNESNIESYMLSQFDYTDNKIFGKYSEKYAKGKIDCVVEIPVIEFRQCIFTGTREQIKHDLGVWLPVTAMTGYTLGETRYCIYMHNPTNQSIQISKAQDGLKKNDYIVVTKGLNVYLYSVTDIRGEDRFEAAKKYVENENVGPEKLYLFTCAKGKWNGKSLVIDATLYNKYNIKVWEKDKAKILKEYLEDFK